MSHARTTAGDLAGAAHQQFLTFKLAGEEYGVGILTVQEIRGWSAVTAIPHSPPWVLGVIDLRGVVVPVIDLRRRFELAPAEFGPATVVIVIRVNAGNEERTVLLSRFYKKFRKQLDQLCDSHLIPPWGCPDHSMARVC